MNEQRRIKDQTDAIGKFRRWAAVPSMIVIDTETTGLEGMVWEFAAVRVYQPTPTLAFLCATDGQWTPKALEMAGPDRIEQISMAAEKEAFQRPLDRLFSLNWPVSYNGAFDSAAIRRTWDTVTVPDFQCAMKTYAPLAGRWSETRQEWKNVTLQAACEREGVNVALGEFHTAYGDALLCAALIQAVAARDYELPID